ncbi:MAG: SCO family protein [Pseudomonadota bacterium]
MTKWYALLAAMVAAIGLGIGVTIVMLQQPASDQFAQCRDTRIAGGGGGIGGPFELVSGSGETVTQADVIAGPTMVYFGYTYCPDVCPVDLNRNGLTLDVLAEQGVDGVGAIFITVDPERDGVEEVGAYAGYMHEEMVGLTGERPAIDAAIASYRVYASKVGDGEDYLMDHSNFTYLMHPEHGLLDLIRGGETPQAAAERIACFVDHL